MNKLFTKDNVTIIIKAMAMSLFFTGTGQIFHLVQGKKTWMSSFVMIALAITILMIDDGSLSELYELKTSQLVAAQPRNRDD